MAGSASGQPGDHAGLTADLLVAGARLVPGSSGSAGQGGATCREPSLPVTRVRPAYQQVAQQLRDLITSARLVPGQRLPSEADLGALFGVGRTTIREALRQLSSEQLLATTRGVRGGTFVVTPDADSISQYLETSIGLLNGTNRLTISELLEARDCLELPATRLAAERLDPARLASIAASVREGSAPSAQMEHSGFHIAILEAAGNRMLAVMGRPIFAVLRTRLDRAAAPSDFWDRVTTDHQRIYEAIAARDASLATERMAEHLGHLSSVYSEIDFAARQRAKDAARVQEESG